MPKNLHVRNVEDELVSRLKRRAARNGRSAEAEHREILRHALTPEVERFLELAARSRAMTTVCPQTPSEVLQREGREEIASLRRTNYEPSMSA